VPLEWDCICGGEHFSLIVADREAEG